MQHTCQDTYLELHEHSPAKGRVDMIIQCDTITDNLGHKRRLAAFAVQVQQFQSPAWTRKRDSAVPPAEYDRASLYMVSFNCFVTKACARRPGAAASVKRRQRERRALLAGAAGALAGATRLRQAMPSRACTFSVRQSLCAWLHWYTHRYKLKYYSPRKSAVAIPSKTLQQLNLEQREIQPT